MNRVIFEITLRQVLGRRRTIIMALVALVPVGLSLLVRWGGDGVHPDEWAAEFLYPVLIVGALLPLAALVFGTAVLGSDFDDGTAVYLLTKPLKRREIIIPKLAVAWVVTATTMALSSVAAGVVTFATEGDPQIAAGFTAATLVGALVYCALFLALSIITGRALIIGLAYVFVWEGVITGLFAGTRNFSVREYTLALSERLSGAPPDLFTAQLGEVAAIVGMAIALVGATWIAIRQLEVWEIGERA